MTKNAPWDAPRHIFCLWDFLYKKAEIAIVKRNNS